MKDRRKLLKLFGGITFGAQVNILPKALSANNHEKFVLQIQTGGGWDVTAFCDPKVNVSGERKISKWSDNDEIAEAGNIPYAPFADNSAFFNEYHSDMLVINGVDTLTNGHSIGQTHTWSGRTAVGFPSLTAIYSSYYGDGLAIPYLSFGPAFSKGENLIQSIKIDDGSSLRSVLNPFVDVYSGEETEETELLEKIHDHNTISALGYSNSSNIVRGNYINRKSFFDSLNSTTQLKFLASQLPGNRDFGNLNQFEKSIWTALSAFKAGTTLAADINHGHQVTQGGWDSHSYNDQKQETLMRNLTSGIDFLWKKAEDLGIAERLFVIISSDFSRTPYYNSGDGKDHWNVGSYIFMERNQNYTDRVIGATDGAQNAIGVNPKTLKSDDSVKLVPGHIHKALRKYLGLSGTSADEYFNLKVDYDFDFFT